MTDPLHVVATAGHVDHGKSSLIVRLTGIDPDRWEEEKRRGLTIDLGFAWCALPSGREIGFVDVPGHERFIRNMLAGMGPVKLVLFVVAADEGWKPQSEEHLAIADVLGAQAGVVALTKRDLVDDARLAERTDDVRARLAGTVLEASPVVPCSATTGEGLDDLRRALDEMVAAAPRPEDRDRPRLFVDRSFTIKGSGTVVTGTLTGGTLSVGDEVALLPSGARTRVRSLQTHRRSIEVARPVSRVAANLAGTATGEVERGDALVRPRQWRPTGAIEVHLRTVRSLGDPLTNRGAFKLHLGSAERDASLRLYGTRELAAGQETPARIRLSGPVVAAVGDRFVLREVGRRETVGGGVVLDTDPPRRADEARLARRERAPIEDLPALLVAERGGVRVSEIEPLTGASPAEISGATRLGSWWVHDETLGRLRDVVSEALEAHHRDRPLLPGMDRAVLRDRLAMADPSLASHLEADLAASLLERLESEGLIAREGPLLRLAGHRVALGAREEEAGRVVAAVEAGEPTPPDVPTLLEHGFDRELIDAVCRVGRLARVSKEVVVTPAFLERAERVAREQAGSGEGLTVSGFRQALGTTRKYALPLLGSFDERGITRRDGDVRRLVDG
ncbi:MAG TPA: selenocysteine-specific translation elongation factor [Actinomycetota bacterium]